MAIRAQKGKDVVGTLETSRKRVHPTTQVPRALTVLRGQTRRYGSRWIEKVGKKLYNKHTESKYAPNEIIDRESLHREFPIMVRSIEELHMNFIFEQPTECNTHLIREFYANWDPRDPNLEIKICEKVVTFNAHDLNSILGIHEVDTY